jgi:hypothetical protein
MACYVTATGASASISVTTSMIVGRLAASATALEEEWVLAKGEVDWPTVLRITLP